MIDLEQALQFIEALTGSRDTPCIFQTIDDDADRATALKAEGKDDPRRRIIRNTMTGAHAGLSHLNDQQAAVFLQINEGTDRGIKNVTALRALWIDDDGETPLPPLTHRLPPNIVVDSSFGFRLRKRHSYWLLQPGEPTSRFEAAQRQLAKHFHTDDSIVNLDRVMRLPGSTNRKKETPKDPKKKRDGTAYPVKLVKCDTTRRYTIDEILAVYASSTAPTPTSTPAPPTPEGPATEQALAVASRMTELLNAGGHGYTRTGTTFTLHKCLLDPSHGGMKIHVLNSGATWAGCFHKHCGGNANMWVQVKLKLRWTAGRVEFSRGDDLEVAQWMQMDIHNMSSEDPVYADGALWLYSHITGLYEPFPIEDQTRIMERYAGASTGAKKKAFEVDTRRVNSVSTMLCRRTANKAFFDDAPFGVAFANGFLKVAGGEIAFEAHSAANRARIKLGFDFDPHMRPSRFLRYLDEVFAVDVDRETKIAVLQEFIGGALAGVSTRYQKAMIFLGEGENGKSVLMDIVGALFPKETVASVRPQDMGHPYARAALLGVRLNIVAEVPEHDVLDTGAFKGIVVGNRIDAREPGEKHVNFKPIAAQLFDCNRLPGTTDQTHAFYRRWLILTFNVLFNENNPLREEGLAEKIIAAEMPGIAAWAVEGARRLLAQDGYTKLDSSAAAKAEWRRETDPVARFHDDHVVVDANEAIDALALYQAFAYWAELHGYKKVGSNKFGARLKGLGLQPVHKETGNIYRVRLVNLAVPSYVH